MAEKPTASGSGPPGPSESHGGIRRLAYVGEVVALASVYVVAARFGLTLDAVAGFATLVWAPTGICLAALLLWGYRVWPGVMIGAAVANALSGAPVVAALGIATGNTLEAVAGVYLLRRVPGFRPSLDRLTDVLALIGLAAMLSTFISATIGVTSLYLAGIISMAAVGAAWRAWWLGDLFGALLVAPALLVWGTRPRLRLALGRAVEATGLALLTVAVSFVLFGRAAEASTDTLQHAYLIFPPLIWAALRFEQRGAATATLVVSLIAVWATVTGRGPFVRADLSEGLLALQTFVGVTAATFLLLAAAIAERRLAEEELRLAHQTVAAANHAKAEFFAVMSHELRTPLNAIAGYVQLLALGIQGPLTQEQRDTLERIQRSQQHLLSLISDVLTFAKIEADQLAIDVKTVMVREAVDELEPLVGPDLRRKALTFSCNGCDASLSVRADPSKLRQILLNIVVNAIKFTPDGGRISLSAIRTDDTVRIAVSDSGIGIPPELTARVFEPFFQVERGPTRRYPGVGLGLTIARDLARGMGGEVHVASTGGDGTTVSLSLPAA